MSRLIPIVLVILLSILPIGIYKYANSPTVNPVVTTTVNPIKTNKPKRIHKVKHKIVRHSISNTPVTDWRN